MLNDGKLEHYLKKHAAALGSKAVHSKILSNSTGLGGVVAIKQHIKDNREPARQEWKTLTASSFQDFFGEQVSRAATPVNLAQASAADHSCICHSRASRTGCWQFVCLKNDLMYDSKKTKAYSLKAMLVAFLQHIVNTNQVQQSSGLQQELSGYIKDICFKTNSLRSLWARLDGQDDPDMLGAAAARYVERRRQRELAETRAKSIFTLGKPNRTMPVVELTLEHQQLEEVFKIKTSSDIFKGSKEMLDGDEFIELRTALRENYMLEVFKRGDFNDVFSVFAIEAYKHAKIKGRCVSIGTQTSSNEDMIEAGKQLRSVVAAQVTYFCRTNDRYKEFSAYLGEPIESYVERILDGSYRGDLFCLFILTSHFKRSVRVWLPGIGSVIVRSGRSCRSACAYQMLLMAGPADRQDAASYDPQWFPIMKKRPGGVHINIDATSFFELPMTDDDTDSRLTEDVEIRLPVGRAARVRQRMEAGPALSTSAYHGKRPRQDNDES